MTVHSGYSEMLEGVAAAERVFGKFNDSHAPAGSPDGGQFTSGDAGPQLDDETGTGLLGTYRVGDTEWRTMRASGYEHGDGPYDVDVAVNPTKHDLVRLARNSPSIRMIRDKAGNVYAWPGRDVFHDSMAQALGVTYGEDATIYYRRPTEDAPGQFMSDNPNSPPPDIGRWTVRKAKCNPSLLNWMREGVGAAMRVFDKFNPNHAPAGPSGGQFTSGGGGLAIFGENVSATIDKMQRDIAESLPKGVRYKTHIEFANGELHTSVYDADEGPPKYDNRSQIAFSRSEDGNLNAEINLLQVQADKQGAGYGRAVLAKQFEAFRALGVDQVTLHANMTAGGYVWARAGFNPLPRPAGDFAATDFDHWLGNGPDGGYLKFMLSGKAFDGPTVASVYSEADALKINLAVQRLRNAYPNDWLYRTANLTLGGKRVGRDVLAGSDWYGTLNMKDEWQMSRLAAFITGKQT